VCLRACSPLRVTFIQCRRRKKAWRLFFFFCVCVCFPALPLSPLCRSSLGVHITPFFIRDRMFDVPCGFFFSFFGLVNLQREGLSFSVVVWCVPLSWARNMLFFDHCSVRSQEGYIFGYTSFFFSPPCSLSLSFFAFIFCTPAFFFPVNEDFSEYHSQNSNKRHTKRKNRQLLFWLL
jgi:hypothetical protein